MSNPAKESIVSSSVQKIEVRVRVRWRARSKKPFKSSGAIRWWVASCYLALATP